MAHRRHRKSGGPISRQPLEICQCLSTGHECPGPHQWGAWLSQSSRFPASRLAHLCPTWALNGVAAVSLGDAAQEMAGSLAVTSAVYEGMLYTSWVKQECLLFKTAAPRGLS